MPKFKVEETHQHTQRCERSLLTGKTVRTNNNLKKEIKGRERLFGFRTAVFLFTVHLIINIKTTLYSNAIQEA